MQQNYPKFHTIMLKFVKYCATIFNFSLVNANCSTI